MPSPILKKLTQEEWTSLTPHFLDHNYQNTWAYSTALAARRGATVEHVALRQDNHTLALAAVRIKPMPLLGGGLAYLPGGPLVRHRSHPTADALPLALHALTHEYSLRRGMLLRLLPPIGNPAYNAATRPQYKDAGFAPTSASAAYRTLLLDITRPLKEIRAALNQKWRNCLNSGEKKPHTLTTGTSPELFARFCELFDRFNQRKGFHVDLEPAFYQSLQTNLPEHERFTISLIENEGRTIAGHVSSMLGDTCVYLLGATDEEGLKNKAAYILQWAAIVNAKERLLTSYDLGGIDPEANPNVFHFKSGLNGADLSAPGPFEYARKSWRAALTLRAEKLYRSLKKKPTPTGKPA